MTSPLLRSAKHVSKLAAFSARRRERLTQSFRVFLLGLVIACGVEVAVDWHATLSEVRALRERMRDRCMSYLAVLDRSLAEAVAERDALAIERLVNGVFDDRDAIFVRITDAGASTLFERLDPSFARAFERDRDRSFADYYAHQLERDARGILRTRRSCDGA